ncbi:hypothetical protein T484DRAFT_3607483 [Baffinella frigidus]|nr:hypothetical protein T484DRAFT_3607483 [Cryptophyta sp. CCMP2293]
MSLNTSPLGYRRTANGDGRCRATIGAQIPASSRHLSHRIHRLSIKCRQRHTNADAGGASTRASLKTCPVEAHRG